MTTKQLRQEIKRALDRLPAERLTSLADDLEFLARVPLERRIKQAESAIAAGKGVSWRAVRSDV
jgi:hypothetical protein